MNKIKSEADNLEKELEKLEKDLKEIFLLCHPSSMKARCEMWSIMTGTHSMWAYQWFKGIKTASWRQVLKMAKALK